MLTPWRIWHAALLLFASTVGFSQGLTLDSLVRMGIRSNPELLVSLEENEEIASDTLFATIPKNPHLEVDAGYNLSRPDRPKAGARISREFQVGVRNGQYKVSKARVDANHEWQKSRELEIELEIRSAYFTWQILNRKASLQKEVQKRWVGLSRIAAAKVKEGRLSQVEEAQARLNLAKARQKESELGTEMESLEKRLAYLTGQNSLLDTLASVFIDSFPSVPSLDSLMGLAVKESRSLKALDKEVVAQGMQAGLEKALRNPALTLSLGYEREMEGDNVLGAGFELPLPLFNRNQAGIARAQSSLKLAERRRRTAEMKLKTELSEIHGRLTDLATRYRNHHEEISVLSLKQLELSEKGFLQGMLGVFELSRVQEEFLSLEGEALNILDENYRQWNRLSQAVGATLW
ncbi:MAG: TolC family protein [Fibrobacterota bacterium]|nr:TolC family protein [Fibrobacterota bacterium]